MRHRSAETDRFPISISPKHTHFYPFFRELARSLGSLSNSFTYIASHQNAPAVPSSLPRFSVNLCFESECNQFRISCFRLLIFVYLFISCAEKQKRAGEVISLLFGIEEKYTKTVTGKAVGIEHGKDDQASLDKGLKLFIPYSTGTTTISRTPTGPLSHPPSKKW